jgi:hypothetical protein
MQLAFALTKKKAGLSEYGRSIAGMDLYASQLWGCAMESSEEGVGCEVLPLLVTIEMIIR